MKKLLSPIYIYPLLVFIGFYNYYLYFSYFDIEIASFLTFSELLMSFMPFTNGILILISIIAVFLIFGFIEISFSEEKEESESVYGIHERIKNSLNQIKEIVNSKKWKSISTYFNLFIFSFQFLTSVFLFFFLIIYPAEFLNVVFDNSSFFGLHIEVVFIAGFVWLVVFSEHTSKIRNRNRDFGYLVLAVLFFLFVIGTITISIRMSAKKILNGEPEYFISLEYGKEKIKTDNNLVFIGKTEKYLFLRDLLERKNKIYPMDKVDLIEMIKVREIEEAIEKKKECISNANNNLNECDE